MTATTSIHAYHDHEASGKASTQRARIMAYMRHQTRPVSRREIARALGLETSTVSGRVNELMDVGIVAVGRMQCPVTGKKVHALKAVPEQIDAFEGAA